MRTTAEVQHAFDRKPRSATETAAMARWLAKRVADAAAHHKGQISFYRDQFDRSTVQLVNLQQIAQGLAEQVSAGRVSVAEAVGDLQEMYRLVAESEAAYDTAIDGMATITAPDYDQVAAYEAFVLKFPALAQRTPDDVPFEP